MIWSPKYWIWLFQNINEPPQEENIAFNLEPKPKTERNFIYWREIPLLKGIGHEWMNMGYSDRSWIDGLTQNAVPLNSHSHSKTVSHSTWNYILINVNYINERFDFSFFSGVGILKKASPKLEWKFRDQSQLRLMSKKYKNVLV